MAWRGWTNGVRGTALAACVVLPMVLPASVQQLLALRREETLAGFEVWRLWSGHLVHFGWSHALFDGIAWIVLSMWCWQRIGMARWAVAMLIGAPLLSAAVWLLEPGLSEYRGASGLVVALVAWTWVHGWRGRVTGRLAWALLGLAIVAKLVWDVCAGASAVLPAGVTVAWSAHLAGALLGAAWGLKRAPDPRR